MTREEQINAVAVSNAIEFRNNLIKEEVDENIAKMYSNIALSYFEKGAKYADSTFMEKACEWLKNNVEKYYYLDEAYDKVISIKNLNNDFKKYMEG